MYRLKSMAVGSDDGKRPGCLRRAEVPAGRPAALRYAELPGVHRTNRKKPAASRQHANAIYWALAKLLHEILEIYDVLIDIIYLMMITTRRRPA